MDKINEQDNTRWGRIYLALFAWLLIQLAFYYWLTVSLS